MARSKPAPEPQQGLIAQAIDLLLLPLRIALSPLARPAYLSTFLLLLTSLFLLLTSSIAYLLFYHAYVPHAAVSVPIYLQYAHQPGASSNCPPPSGSLFSDQSSTRPSLHPYGTNLLTPSISSGQKYDVQVVLHMPRSPANLRAGNFMVDLALLAPKPGAGTATENPTSDPAALEEEARAMLEESSGAYGSGIPGSLATATEGVVARARRPAMMRYKSREVDIVRKLVGLPWYALGWKHESETVEAAMLEDVEFNVPRNRNLRGALGVPDRVRIALESREVLEVYSVTVEVRARLRGLRWLMYRHRVLSFVVFTAMFYAATMGSAVVVYGALTIRQIMQEGEEPERKGERKRIKEEPEDDETGLSDTSRTFPSRTGQQPLKYTGRGRKYEGEETVVKKEEDDDDALALADIAPLEADDEDNADDYDDAGDSFRDSGIGTSIEERNRDGARRRKRTSRNVQEEGGWDGKGRLPGL